MTNMTNYITITTTTISGGLDDVIKSMQTLQNLIQQNSNQDSPATELQPAIEQASIDTGRRVRRVYSRGAGHGNAKLTDDNVRAIKTAQLNPERGQGIALARRYGVTQQTISNIKCSRTRADVTI